MRGRILMLVAFASACQGAPPMRTPAPDLCQDIDARVRKLVSEGWLDRGATIAHDNAKLCPERAPGWLDAVRSLHEGEPDALLAAAAREPSVVEARKLRDRAMRRLEEQYGATARLGTELPAFRQTTQSQTNRFLFSVPDPSPPIPEAWLLDLDGHRREIVQADHATFSPDDRWMIHPAGARAASSRAVLRETTPESPPLSFEGRLSAGAFDPRSKRAFLWTGEDSFHVVDLATRRTVFELRTPAPTSTSFDSSGRILVWSEPKELHILDLETMKAWSGAAGGEISVTDSYVVAHGRVGDSEKLIVVRTSDLTPILEVEGSSFAIEGSRLATVSSEKSGWVLTAHDLVKGTKKRFPIKQEMPCSRWGVTAITKGRAWVASCGLADGLEIDLSSGAATYHPPASGAGGDADYLGDYYAEKMKEVDVCAKAGGHRCERLYGHGNSGGHNAFGMYIERDDDVAVLDSKTGRLSFVLAESKSLDLLWDLPRLEVRSSETSIYAADVHGRARMWDARDGKVVWRGPARGERAWLAALNDDGSVVAASPFGTVRRWQADGRLASTWTAPGCRLASWSPGELVACEDDVGSRRVHRSGLAAPIRIEAGTPVALDARAGLLAKRTADGRVEVFDVATMKRSSELPARSFLVYLLVEGSRVVTVATEVILWDARSGKEEARIEGRRRPIFSRDGAWLVAVGSTDIEALRLDGSGRRVTLPGVPEMEPLTEETAADATSFAMRVRDEIVVWSLDAPSAPPRRLNVSRLERLAAISGPNLLLAGEGVRLASIEGGTTIRHYLAAPFTEVGLSLAPGVAPTITGDEAEALALGRCIIGPRTLPIETCLGRFGLF